MTVSTLDEILNNAIDAHQLLAHQALRNGWEKDAAIHTARARFAKGMLTFSQMRNAPASPPDWPQRSIARTGT